MSGPRPARGFTLTELLVSLVVTAIVAAGAFSLLTSQQRAFTSTTSDRALQESARAALSELTMNLRRAGYGVDPWLAIDFGPLAAGPTPNQSYPSGPPGGTTVACTGSAAVTCRDSTSASDQIVFYARDPAFSRTLGAAPSSTTLTFATALSEKLLPGQILQIMCSGAGDRAYVTVSSTAADLLSVTLSGTATGRFPYEQARISGGCFAQSPATTRVFKVDRFHYFVATYTDPDHPAGRAYLMLDRGLSDAGGAIVEPVAPDVEDVQFAFVFRSGTVVGRTAGTALSNAATSVDLTSAPPEYDAESADASRATNSPANIRSVLVSAVVRSPAFDPRLAGTAERTIPAALNRAANTAGPIGYRRLLVETSAAVRNLDARAPFVPPYTANGGADGLNVGGG